MTDLMQSAQAVAWTGARIIGKLPAAFSGVGTDTRTLHAGELFVALHGPRFDGANFLSTAAASGAAAALVGEHAPSEPATLPRLVVDDTLRALGEMARGYRLQFHPRSVVAVTGSVGKTTVKELTASALSPLGPVLKTEGNLNNEIGVPLTLFRLRQTHAAAVIEMGMSHRGEIARLSEIAQPGVGVITSVHAVHLASLGSIDEVARAKGELFSGLPADGIAVANAGDSRVMEQAKASGRKVVTFGLEGADVSLIAVDSADLTGLEFRVNAFGEMTHVQLALLGEHNALNACAALAAAIVSGVSASQAATALETARSASHRLQLVPLDRGISLLDDCYNASPASVRAALDTLRRAAAGRRLGAVLGDMLELGPDELALHREVGRASAGLSWLLAVGPRSGEIALGAREVGVPVVSHLADPEDLPRLRSILGELLRPGDAFLLKGSRGMRLERVIQALGVSSPGDAGAH
jgi:UDP-N-acetylmuramoyl-tripeptide--D-alanyl-D-alanine ligase